MNERMPTRATAGRCTARSTGEHEWVEHIALEDAGLLERYVCRFCSARAEEVTEQGAARMAANALSASGAPPQP